MQHCGDEDNIVLSKLMLLNGCDSKHNDDHLLSSNSYL